MPNSNRTLSAFIQGGNPDTMNIQITGVVGSNVPYAPGDVGASFDYNNKTYSVVIMDSGATSANPVGAPTSGQIAFWKSISPATVTNDFRQSINPASPQSAVAGIIRVTPGTLGAGGNLICILNRGYAINVNAGTCAAGQVMADSTASTSRAVTTTGILKSIGTARSADAAGVVIVDVDIATLP